MNRLNDSNNFRVVAWQEHHEGLAIKFYKRNDPMSGRGKETRGIGAHKFSLPGAASLALVAS